MEPSRVGTADHPPALKCFYTQSPYGGVAKVFYIHHVQSEQMCVATPLQQKLATMAPDILLIFCLSTVVSVLHALCGVGVFSEDLSANKEGLKS